MCASYYKGRKICFLYSGIQLKVTANILNAHESAVVVVLSLALTVSLFSLTEDWKRL